MSPANRLVVARKVAEIRGRVERVRQLLPTTEEQFLASRTEAEALILNLFLALQACSDLALHVVADRGLGVAPDARTGFEILGRMGLVPTELSRAMASAVGPRNRIAHEYGGLDLALVFEAALDGIGDLVAFAAAIATAYSAGE